MLEVHERPDPPMRSGHVRVAVAAAGINFADTMARTGIYPDAPKPPMVVGYEVAGTVAEVGPTSTGFAVGDRVMAVTKSGGFESEVVLPEDDVIPLPDRLTLEQGAAIPVNYSSLGGAARVRKLARGRSRAHPAPPAGCVGIGRLSWPSGTARWCMGLLRPRTRSARALGVDAARLPAAGLDRGLDGRLDLVLDAVGGASVRRSYALLRTGGRVVAYGASSLQTGERRNLPRMLPQALRMWRGFDLISQMSDSKTVIGLNMLRLLEDRRTLEPWLTPLQPLIDDGTVDPVVAEAVPFDRAADAHRLIAERRNVGKVVLTP